MRIFYLTQHVATASGPSIFFDFFFADFETLNMWAGGARITPRIDIRTPQIVRLFLPLLLREDGLTMAKNTKLKNKSNDLARSASRG